MVRCALLNRSKRKISIVCFSMLPLFVCHVIPLMDTFTSIILSNKSINYSCHVSPFNSEQSIHFRVIYFVFFFFFVIHLADMVVWVKSLTSISVWVGGQWLCFYCLLYSIHLNVIHRQPKLNRRMTQNKKKKQRKNHNTRKERPRQRQKIWIK